MIWHVVHEALAAAGRSLDDLDALAVCHGPGLIGSLLVGCGFAKALCYARGIPLVAVNHLEATFARPFLKNPGPRSMLRARFTRDFTYAMAYTWSKAMDTADLETSILGYPTDIRSYEYKRSGFDRRHMLTLRYVWNMPRLSPKLHDSPAIKAVFDRWELSGFSAFMSGNFLLLLIIPFWFRASPINIGSSLFGLISQQSSILM
jgi:hypothetical protein